MNAVIKYPGSKWALADWIINFFPEHHSYLEPFFGSGAVLFTKMPSAIETVNDLVGDVVNLFRCIQQDSERLARLVMTTPCGDCNFKSALERATDEEIQEIISNLDGKSGVKTKLKALEEELRRARR